MTVYVIQSVKGFDYSGLIPFGQPKFVTYRHCFADEAEVHVQGLYKAARELSANFNPDEDYLAIAGDPINIVVLTSILLKDHGRARLLKFDRKFDGYYPVDVQI